MNHEQSSPPPPTERVIDGLHELTVDVSASPLANDDILPVPVRERTWNTWNMASLWVGIAVCIPTYMLAAGLIAAGMNWTQAIWTIMLGNAIVLIPLCLNAYPGTKYGIPFPVLIRSSFGTRGAQIPSVLRALVACGWFGIQAWIGGKAIYELARIPFPAIARLAPGLRESFVGINGGELICFLIFWFLHMIIVWKGTESIKWFESLAAPALILVGLALLVWAVRVGGGLGNVLEQSECFVRPTLSLETGEDTVLGRLDPLRDEDGLYRPDRMRVAVAPDTLADAEWEPFRPEFEVPWTEADRMEVMVEIGVAADEEAVVVLTDTARRRVAPPPGPWAFTIFFPLLTAMVGYWATLSLNIPDFTRYAHTQKAQILGQAIGLPATMTLYSFVGVVATCASLIAFPRILAPEVAPWDPVDLLAHFRIPWMIILSMGILALATLTTNIAANVVAPANGFSNLAPTKISFRMGGLITGLIGIVMMPWKLLANVGAYIFTWLIGYSALMGGVAGVMIADYYLVRKRKLDLEGLYRTDGPYVFTAGFNWAGIVAFILGVLPNIPGFLVQTEIISPELAPGFFRTFYTYAWFTSFAISFVIYTVWMKARSRSSRLAPNSPDQPEGRTG